MSQDNASVDEDSSEEQNDADSSDMETVLYCFPREATSADDITKLRNVLENVGFELSASEGDGNNLLIQREKESGSSVDLSEVLES